MAAASPRETAIIDRLRGEFGHVSAERVVSGPGLENLYRAVVALDGVDAAPRDAAQITKAAWTAIARQRGRPSSCSVRCWERLPETPR
jgi:glucokinase